MFWTQVGFDELKVSNLENCFKGTKLVRLRVAAACLAGDTISISKI